MVGKVKYIALRQQHSWYSFHDGKAVSIPCLPRKGLMIHAFILNVLITGKNLIFYCSFNGNSVHFHVSPKCGISTFPFAAIYFD